MAQLQAPIGVLDAFDPGDRDRDSGPPPFPLEVLEERLLRMHLGAELQVAGGRHRDRVGVDGLAARKVRDGREGSGGFEDLERQPGLARFDRGRDA